MPQQADASWLDRDGLPRLLEVLRERGYRVLGPVLRDGAVMLDELRSAADLPVGWRDSQQPGAYRLEPSDSPRCFGVVSGPASPKSLAFAPREHLLQIELGPGELRAEPVLPAAERIAVLGVRACDLAGVAVQDRVFLQDRFPDPYYAVRRAGLFLVGVSCTRSVSTCFCTSMDTGPEVTSGHDIALTELDAGFVVRPGSPAGEEVLRALPTSALPSDVLREERSALERCARGIERKLETRDLPDLLYENLQHPRWDEVAERCISCGNCTQVCPTCFCHDERDEPELDGRHSLRVREWSSCFDRDHGQISGYNFRPRVRDRYRQWLVHKLASWIDQFGSSGCVGCGRCITWCPAGIDLTEEVAAIRGSSGAGGGA